MYSIARTEHRQHQQQARDHQHGGNLLQDVRLLLLGAQLPLSVEQRLDGVAELLLVEKSIAVGVEGLDLGADHARSSLLAEQIGDFDQDVAPEIDKLGL